MLINFWTRALISSFVSFEVPFGGRHFVTTLVLQLSECSSFLANNFNRKNDLIFGICIPQKMVNVIQNCK